MLKVAIINMFTELKETMIKEIKEGKIKMLCLTENVIKN